MAMDCLLDSWSELQRSIVVGSRGRAGNVLCKQYIVYLSSRYTVQGISSFIHHTDSQHVLFDAALEAFYQCVNTTES